MPYVEGKTWPTSPCASELRGRTQGGTLHVDEMEVAHGDSRHLGGRRLDAAVRPAERRTDTASRRSSHRHRPRRRRSAAAVQAERTVGRQTWIQGDQVDDLVRQETESRCLRRRHGFVPVYRQPLVSEEGRNQNGLDQEG